jgi:inner membrane protein
MPSPIAHTLAGLGGFMLVHRPVAPPRRMWVLLISVVMANLADFDVLPGLLLLGDPTAFHHQGTHSLTAALTVGCSVAVLTKLRKGDGFRWGAWAFGIYFSHLFLDLLVNDPSPPFGAQVLWPLSDSYFISPVTPFRRFDYFNPEMGMIRTLLSLSNIRTLFWEAILMAPFIGICWFCGRYRQEEALDDAVGD